ncbi:MAG TPA: class I SAM-dependent methyltransferase [Thermoplasmata archaeon]|nr:class I SAM-dependent methyltransferase [Thermoplasmata archaeon]
MSAPGPGPASEATRSLGRRFRDDPVEVIVGGLFHRHLHPTLVESFRSAALQSVDVGELLSAIPSSSDPSLAALEPEFAACWESLAKRLRPELTFAERTGFRRNQGWLLYAWVRRNRPNRIVETGVANGVSSCVLLEALRRNGSGQLTSFDIVASAGELVPAELRPGWDLRILPASGRAAAFRSAMAGIGPIQLFLHDSDHGYPWMELEMRTAWDRLAPGGLLAADDIDWSYAFIDFARAVGLRPWVLIDAPKPFGLLRRPAASGPA